ncbi:HEAT repeat domain-containing protein [Verrucomicrobium sp. BvORR106]|uniref:HEAT repeat domain-containing protein n=1 Tax=Verrucomicrobium sp. BvORR106 TaxID=1403819 RepID=UPI000571B777|nr:HEAT repeat domain-containing protein [Verrucomicrobium sp. BvORR106]
MSGLPYLSIFIALLTAVLVGLVGWGVHIWRKRQAEAVARRREQFSDAWLQELLPVLEEERQISALPLPGTAEEMNVAMHLILELVERVRGQYRDQLRKVLDHIGAEATALHDLVSGPPEIKISSCRLLALTQADPNVDLQLSRALYDADWTVRLEAAYALSVRQPLGLTLESLLSPLRTTPAFETELAQKVVKQFAPLPGRGEELARALMGSRNPQERVVLLAGIADADDLMLGDVVAWQLSDYSSAVRLEAVRTLERMADPVQINKVTSLTSDPEPAVRQAVAAYAGSMGGGSSAQLALQALLSDPSPDVRQVAEAGLRRWQSGGHAPTTTDVSS